MTTKLLALSNRNIFQNLLAFQNSFLLIFRYDTAIILFLLGIGQNCKRIFLVVHDIKAEHILVLKSWTTAVSKFGSVFSFWQEALLCNHFSWEFCCVSVTFLCCSSLQSLLGPENDGWSQKGASLRVKSILSFHISSNIIKPAGAG